MLANDYGGELIIFNYSIKPQTIAFVRFIKSCCWPDDFAQA